MFLSSLRETNNYLFKHPTGEEQVRGESLSYFEVVVRTHFGRIVLHFENITELDSLTPQIPEILRRMGKIAADHLPAAIPPVEPRLEHVYANLPGNLTKLYRTIGTKADTVTFILYTKYPLRMSIPQIAASSGITTEDARKILQHAKYRDRFIGNKDTGFSLSQHGLQIVTENIKPRLLKIDSNGRENEDGRL